MEVRYATIQLSRSLLVFRLLDRVGAGPIGIRGIQLKFQRQCGQLSFLRIFRRVVDRSFRGRVVSIFAFEWRQLSFRGWRLEGTLLPWLSEPCFATGVFELQPFWVPCRPQQLNDCRQPASRFGEREGQARATNRYEG